MKCTDFNSSASLDEKLEVVEWLVLKVADLCRRQRHVFQKRMSTNRGYPRREIYETDRASVVTALHYVAVRCGKSFHYEVRYEEENQRLLHKLRALTEKAKRIVETVLTDPLRDCCNCTCSIEGCSACTVMVKYGFMCKYGKYSATRA